MTHGEMCFVAGFNLYKDFENSLIQFAECPRITTSFFLAERYIRKKRSGE